MTGFWLWLRGNKATRGSGDMAGLSIRAIDVVIVSGQHVESASESAELRIDQQTIGVVKTLR